MQFGRGAGQLGPAGPRSSGLSQHPHAVRAPRPRRARRQPDRGVSPALPPPRPLACSPDVRADRIGGCDGLGLGERLVRRDGQGQPFGLDVRDHRSAAHGATTRSRSWCRSGATRAGSRTRTSGGCPGSTARSSCCRSHRCVSPTAPSSPVSPPMARPACWRSMSVSTARIPADCSRWTWRCGSAAEPCGPDRSRCRPYPFDRPEREAAASYLWPGPACSPRSRSPASNRGRTRRRRGTKPR